MNTEITERFDLSKFSDAPPDRPIDLLFIHHSCGGQLFASTGPDDGVKCIYKTHPEGGDLRAHLERSSYRVHEASYGSRVGDRTDIFDWPPKFRNQMDEILRCDVQNTCLPDSRRNEIVVFKSCFPNNEFSSEGVAPGNPAGPDLTVWNARAAYAALLEEFQKHPDVLFVCMTAPPLAPKTPAQPLWKRLAKKALGRPTISSAASGRLARTFNNWLSSQHGWLKDYTLRNAVVFNLYDILTGCGRSDLSFYSSGNGYDSHPSRAGNEKVAEAFVPFLNRAVQSSGLQNRPMLELQRTKGQIAHNIGTSADLS